MRFGSLFAGIGGFDLGFERAGMTPVWQVEIDDYCTRVLEKHWPDVRRYRDVKECGEYNLEPVDLICGGFPCQPYSVAGKRRGSEDDRNLWPEYLRIVRELRPAWVVGENVPGIVPMYLDQVLSDLEGEAYTCWTFNIPACALDAPHRRERIWIVGHSEKLGRDEKPIAISRKYKRPERTARGSSGVISNTSIKREGRLHIRPRRPRQATVDIDRNSKELAYAVRGGCSGQSRRRSGIQPKNRGGWSVEPNVGRVADGIPSRVDRLRALGNAVVPAVAQFIGQRIMECHLANTQEQD